MVLIDPATGAKLAYVFGLMNLLGLLLVFFSCRCLMGSSLFQKLWQKNWYKKFYSMHCYFWWLFFVSVALHALLAIIVYGNPFLRS